MCDILVVGPMGSIVTRWQELPEIQPQADLVAPMRARCAARLQDARVRDVRRGIARNVHDATALQREGVGHDCFLRLRSDGPATAPSRC